MKIIRILSVAAIVALAGSMSAAYAEGSCNYVQENMFAGPFNVCQEPVEAEACAELGETDDNADAVHSDGACASDGLIGTCDLGDSQLHYFSGDAGGLEIGCGFQGGDWISAE
ncbi:MAG: hypothetical protein QF789_05440 [Gammaproteobacteria bacterium]|jgi:hypothetical protein|nr:hypothetical protein [Gammaproteobacteria bacterium]MDP7271669.1 hypothetical protein [Gammaproteobacteria bacterium]MDP7660652.1 hypothetical protein [Gammaproteobacteria bacterium]HJP03476.1 hypothetical protein [Gammaproteobacteria bacterium]